MKMQINTRLGFGVIAGYVVVVVSTMASFLAFSQLLPTDKLQQIEGMQGTARFMLIFISQGILSAILGGYVARRIGRSFVACLSLGVMMCIFGLLNVWHNWGKEPLPFQIMLVLIPLPSTLIGGLLHRPAAGSDHVHVPGTQCQHHDHDHDHHEHEHEHEPLPAPPAAPAAMKSSLKKRS
jgi:hypothetical protein